VSSPFLPDRVSKSPDGRGGGSVLDARDESEVRDSLREADRVDAAVEQPDLERIKHVERVAGKPSRLLSQRRRRVYKAEVPEPHVFDRPRRRPDITGLFRFDEDKKEITLPVFHGVV